MNFTQTKKWLCKDCNYVFQSDDSHHNLDYCPICKNNAIDHEPCLIRIIGNVVKVHGNTKIGKK